MASSKQTSAARAIQIVTIGVRLLAAAVALSGAAAYWTFASTQLFEPYALTWVEPVFARGALESFAGRSVYTAPSLDYTAAIYNPGIAWTGGRLFGWTGPSFVALRIAAFSCFAATIFVLGLFAQRLSRDWGWTFALVACGISTSVAAKHLTTTIHADSASILFAMVAVCLLYLTADPLAGASRMKQNIALIAAAVCVVIGFVFKQQGAAFGLAISLALVVGNPRRAFWFAAVCAGLAALFEAGLLWSTDGWAWLYTFRIPTETGSRPATDFFLVLFNAHPLATLSLAVGAPLLVALERPRWKGFWPTLALSSVVMSYAGYAKVGGAINSLLPAFWMGAAILAALHASVGRRIGNTTVRNSLQLAILAIVTAMAFQQLEPIRNKAARLRAARPPSAPAATASSRATFPRRAAFERRLREAVRSSEGRIFVGARFLAWSDLGREWNTHQIGLFEGTDHAPVFDLELLDRQFAEQPFAKMWVWEHPFDENFEALLRAHYREVGTFGVDPLAGHRVSIWEPIQPGSDEAGAAQ